MATAQQLARISKVLSVESRVKIVQFLKDGALCVGALSARLDVTQGAVSQHLRVLRDAGLVVPDKRGYYVHYRLNEKTLEKWRRAIDDLLATGTTCPNQKEESSCVVRRKAVRSPRN